MNELDLANEKLLRHLSQSRGDNAALPSSKSLPMTRLEDSLFAADKCEHYENLAIKLSRSNVIPKNYIGKPTDLFVAMAMGYQLGMPVEQAIQDIAVINGRPCIYGDGLLAVIMNHPDFEDIIEEEMMDGQKIVGYACTIKRKGRTPTTRRFTLDMAKRAGLLGKSGPWSQYESRMLQMRARGFTARDSFPDALRGIKSREEVEDYVIEGDYVDHTGTSRTQAVKQDWKAKQGAHHAVTQMGEATSTAVHDMEHNEETEAVGYNLQPSEAREPKATLHSGSQDSATITDDQMDMICSLIKEKSFDDDRKAKAFRYFEVETLEELSENKASRFIELLNKTN